MLKKAVLLLFMLLLLTTAGVAQTSGAFQTPVTPDDLDPAAFAVWVDGRETATGLPTDGPRHVVWTQSAGIEWDGVHFGDSKTPGARFLRIGFKTAIPIGSVLTRGGVQVSVLKATASYPGRLGVDADWISARRLLNGQVSTKEPVDEDYAVWTLPAQTQTRALRFTHTAGPNDHNYAGWLGGVFVLSQRLVNLAPQGQARTSANNEHAGLINNESNDGIWGAWENADDASAKTRPLISAEHPEWITLTWAKPVALQGLCGLWAGFSAVDVQIYVGPISRDPRQTSDGDWRTVQTWTGIQNQYPRALGPNWLDFGKTITTRGVRLRITQGTQEGHPHLTGRTAGGRRIWLGELMAFSPLGNAMLASAILPKPALSLPHPPIPIRFVLARPGYVTLVIEDAKGRRVRNLISETYFPHAGPNVAWWDGMDDLGRDPDAAHHGVYHVPGQFVAPGTYTVRGLTRNALDLHYEFSVYNAGNPAWETADGTGGWLTNHTPPSSALFVPGSQAPGGKPLVYLGSFISEGGAGLAWVDLQGRKQGGRGWIGGNWTAAPFLAANAGDRPAPDAYAYVGAAWEGDLRLTALTPGGDRPVLTPGFKFSGATADAQKANSVLNGIAAYNGLLVASLPKQKGLLFVDANLHRQIGLVSLPDPRGVAFDGRGRLLALSGTKLLRFAVPESLSAGVRLDSKGWMASASVHPDDAIKALDGDGNTRWSTNGQQSPGQWFSLDMKSPQTFSTLVLTTQADRDSPRGYEVYTSMDGQNWGAPIAKGEGTPGVTTIAFSRVTARYVKITQTGTAQDVYWSINVLDVVNAPAPNGATASLPEGETLIAAGLEDPQAITLDSAGNIYVSDRGQSHQVKVFAPDGKFLRAIGKAGVPKAGPYDVLRMNNPKGLTIDSQNHLWVAEEDFQPKRVSVWTLDGQFVDAFYGPARYGGGGTLDPKEKTRFYYDGMEFGLDWKTGKNKPVAIIQRPAPGDMALPDGYGAGGPPETPLYAQGRQYMTDAYNSSATNGAPIAMLWRMDGGVAVPVAALGRANDWSLLKSDAFKAKWPQGVDLKGDFWANQTLFAWSDLNGDGKMQPDEVQMQKASPGGVTILPDLSFMESRVDDKITRYAPARFTSQGVPVYDLGKADTLGAGAQGPVSSGGDQALAAPNGWTIAYPPPKPFSQFSVGGLKNGVPLWSYPNLWPGLHAGHEAPTSDHPGELIATTRLLGGFVSPKSSDVGPLFALNGNFGNLYLMTADGLFVGQLFQDIRQGKSWSMPVAKRNMLLNDVSLHDENFFPSITQTADGQVYLVDGGRSSLVRVDGLDSLRRLPAQPLRVTPTLVKEAQAYGVQSEALRQKQLGQGTLAIALRSDSPVVDGKLDDWTGADWATVDKSGVGAYFDSNSKPYNIQAALAVSGDKLYAAWKTGDPNLLRNTGDTPNAPFKTGGALDLMIGARPGGERLLITRVKDKTLAVLYRAQVPGTKDPIPFSSPSRTITIDRVDDVSSQVQLAGADGNYEISVPLSLLGLSPAAAQPIKGDVGILRGNGFQTLQRVYWNNKATGITADVPSEAMLTPELWGTWRFKTP